MNRNNEKLASSTYSVPLSVEPEGPVGLIVTGIVAV